MSKSAPVDPIFTVRDAYRLIFPVEVPLKVGSPFAHTTSATHMARFVITKVEVEGRVFLAELVSATKEREAMYLTAAPSHPNY